jgi:hypothetical protein
MKYYKHNLDRMPIEPGKHDLLGLPGVEAEDPKWYIRRLWLVAEDDRVPYLGSCTKMFRDLHYASTRLLMLQQRTRTRVMRSCLVAPSFKRTLHVYWTIDALDGAYGVYIPRLRHGYKAL